MSNQVQDAHPYKHGDIIIFKDKTSASKKAKTAWLRGKVVAVDKLNIALVVRENGTAYAVIAKDIHGIATDYKFRFTQAAKKLWSRYFSDDIKADLAKIGVTPDQIDKANAIFDEALSNKVESLPSPSEEVQGTPE